MLSSDTEFLNYHFKSELDLLLSRIESNPQISYHDLFGDVDENLFAILARRSFTAPLPIVERLPAWPSQEAITASTSSLPLHMQAFESTMFWRAVRDKWQSSTGRNITEARVADYGGGWGRISRFVAKDVPEGQLVVYEPNTTHCQYFRDCKVPGRLVETDYGSLNPITDGPFDLIICFSILTHSSDLLTHNIRDRWVEMTQPGSLVFTTVRPRFFIGETGGGDAAKLPDDRDQVRAAYDSGEIVYAPYEGSPDWGVTVMSENYIQKVFGDYFTLIKVMANPVTQNQMIMCLERK